MSFLRLPGELRNTIYKQCIINAGLCRCNEFHEPVLNMNRIPQLTSINPLPLLFVNKQIAYEITQMLYSTLKPFVIDGYCFNFSEVPFVREFACWKPFPGGLPCHPYLQNFLRRIDVVVGLEASLSNYTDGSTYDFRLPQPSRTFVLPQVAALSPPAVELLQYLQTFQSLSKLQIFVDIPKRSRDKPPPRAVLSEFLPFHELCEVQVILRFELGMRFHDIPPRKALSDWTNMWIECLTRP